MALGDMIDHGGMLLNPSVTPWMFHRTGDGENTLVTIESHDGTYLGSFVGPHADDNAMLFGPMFRVCNGITPEMLRLIPTIREIIEERLHKCRNCGQLVYGSLVKEPAAEQESTSERKCNADS